MALRQLVQPLARTLRCSAIVQQGPQEVRAFHASAAAKGGAGLPMPETKPIDTPLQEEDELIWDDGSGMYVEGCLDEWVMMSKWRALAMLSTGLSFFAGLYQLAKWNDKASRCPYPLKEFPYNNLSEELGGMPTRGNMISTLKVLKD